MSLSIKICAKPCQEVKFVEIKKYPLNPCWHATVKQVKRSARGEITNTDNKEQR